jgi:isopenicillin-N epimerase
VLLTSHEYGAVQRIWKRACLRAGTPPPVVAELPQQFESAEQVIEAIFSRVTANTRLLVVSHITSPTAVILPVETICRRARDAGIAVCIDGPHAVAQVPLDIGTLGCDFYAASCHKWLSATFGSGFLYVDEPRREGFEPAMLSWGRLLPARPASWDEEFLWSGTRDPSAYLSIPAAIDFLERVGLAQFRDATHELARYAGGRLCELLGSKPFVPDSRDWYGSMACAPLPAGRDYTTLQAQLWLQYGIEAPVVEFQGRWHIRVSCHLYNDRRQIDRLFEALVELMRAD